MNIKQGYKQTEIGIIPEDWEYSNLNECCVKITDGTHDTPKPVESGIPFLTAIHVKQNYIDFDNCYFLPIKVHDNIFKRCNPEKNDVLMVNIGSGTANNALVNVDYEFSLKNVALLKPNAKKITGVFLNQILGYCKDNIVSSLLSGGAQPFLSLTEIGQIKIPFPSSKTEQTAIATALSDIDALIGELDKLIAKKQGIKQATMQQLLTGKKRLAGFSGEWEVKRLGDVGESLIGLTYKPSDVTSDGILVLRSSNVFEGRLRFNDNVFVKSEISERIMVRTGDILICVRNGSRDLIGKCAKIDESISGMTFGAFMAIFRTKFHNFLYHQFQSDVIKKQINEHLGATINQITNKSLNSFLVPTPPTIEEQTAIANILSDMDAEISQLEGRRAKMGELKQGMMQELLTGRIRLTGGRYL